MRDKEGAAMVEVGAGRRLALKNEKKREKQVSTLYTRERGEKGGERQDDRSGSTPARGGVADPRSIPPLLFPLRSRCSCDQRRITLQTGDMVPVWVLHVVKLVSPRRVALSGGKCAKTQVGACCERARLLDARSFFLWILKEQ